MEATHRYQNIYHHPALPIHDRPIDLKEAFTYEGKSRTTIEVKHFFHHDHKASILHANNTEKDQIVHIDEEDDDYAEDGESLLTGTLKVPHVL